MCSVKYKTPQTWESGVRVKLAGSWYPDLIFLISAITPLGKSGNSGRAGGLDKIGVYVRIQLARGGQLALYHSPGRSEV